MAERNTMVGTDLEMAASWLRKGEIVAIPTETVYGLAANGMDDNAVRRIFAAKNRPFFNPLILHIADSSWVDRLASDFPEKARKLAGELWPGPLTMVLPKKPVVSDLVTAGHDTVAIRVPGHLLTVELIQLLDFPLAAPSANPFGYLSPTTAQHVLKLLDGKLPYILDGGACEIGVESTIISFADKQARILRYGGVPVEQIEDLIGPVLPPFTDQEGPLLAPGMMKSHYAPRKKLYFGNIENMISAHHLDRSRVGILSFSKPYADIPADHQIVLSLQGDLEAAANGLFHALHELDDMQVQVILAEEFPNEQLGLAINDRLRRAASPR